jgi:hypothetical protein
MAAACAIAFFAACNTVVGGTCRPYAGGGLGGGAEHIPIGAGVGATTGSGDFLDPPKDPQASGADDPCLAADAPPVAQIGDCKVTWRAGSDACVVQKVTSDCTTEYLTTKRYTSLDDVTADCEHANGVGQGSGAKDCTCGWAKDPVLPARDPLWHGWCFEPTPTDPTMGYKRELEDRFPDKASCVAKVKAQFPKCDTTGKLPPPDCALVHGGN